MASTPTVRMSPRLERHAVRTQFACLPDDLAVHIRVDPELGGADWLPYRSWAVWLLTEGECVMGDPAAWIKRLAAAAHYTRKLVLVERTAATTHRFTEIQWALYTR
ncbi:hypothetical protein IWQ60_011182 [Tieghemiomyces parasiticus]|uniref:Uncharacterized protein n=1 Tax=Tieghemiomyces parasiticus TaxID=78921 RepID=A0A9W7ZNT9_9FUNG|nr:hypothetical protein IWQ60_011182 [Tieghemiomyces parasiticus]